MLFRSGKTDEGEEFDILVIDSEGMGGIEEDQNHDTRIFLLATLLSSLLIYNSVGAIDESALQNISLIINMSQQLQLRSRVGKNQEIIKDYFPSFLWVLRDFALKLTDLKGNPITPKQYLESSLVLQKGTSENIKTKNQIRQVITGVFKKRDCFPLIRPLEDEKAIQNLKNIPNEELRPGFIKQMEQLHERIYKSAIPKRLNGNYINGSIFLELCNIYINAFNSGEIPHIENTWNCICKLQCQNLINKYIDDYANELKKNKEIYKQDSGKFKEFNKEYKKKIMKEYIEKSIGDESIEFKEILKKEIYRLA